MLDKLIGKGVQLALKQGLKEYRKHKQKKRATLFGDEIIDSFHVTMKLNNEFNFHEGQLLVTNNFLFFDRLDRDAPVADKQTIALKGLEFTKSTITELFITYSTVTCVSNLQTYQFAFQKKGDPEKFDNAIAIANNS